MSRIVIVVLNHCHKSIKMNSVLYINFISYAQRLRDKTSTFFKFTEMRIWNHGNNLILKIRFVFYTGVDVSNVYYTVMYIV
jgi:phosphoribosyl-AMP cyclohydrolase